MIPSSESLPCGVVKEHLAIYAGSFDPITNGHLDVLHRARGMFDRIILGIGQTPDKPSLFPVEEREAMARQLVAELATGPELAEVGVARAHGVAQVRDNASREKVLAMVTDIRPSPSCRTGRRTSP